MKQIIAAVHSSTKVSFCCAVSGISIILLDYNYPDQTQGLPEWIIPAIKLATILATVILITSSLADLRRALIKMHLAVGTLTSMILMKSRLLNLNISELHVLCMAIAGNDSIITANPDSSEISSLARKKIIKYHPSGMPLSTKELRYKISPTAWRYMQKMDEFYMPNHASSYRALSKEFIPNNHSEYNQLCKIQKAFPQNHPEVIKWIKRYRDLTVHRATLAP